ncbi:MAG: hypothetical protein CV082_01900 [Candidatus Brocadia sp. BL1]|nr:MAG: hypothetical protein CV082_01900 [Candidatus Brocadia sp. BL1]
MYRKILYRVMLSPPKNKREDLMVLVSAGMPKSGTGYIYNLLNDMFVLSGMCDAREIKRRYKLGSILHEYNCNIRDLTFLKLSIVVLLSYLQRPFVVKTHRRPTLAAKLFLRLGLIKVVYIYRDPRDVLLSDIDHSKERMKHEDTRKLAGPTDFHSAFQNVKRVINTWRLWKQSSGAYLLRYEDLMSNPADEMKKIIAYLNHAISSDHIDTLLKRYDKSSLDKHQKNYLHFNKGIVSRYRQEMQEEHRRIFKEQIGDTLLQMGYPLD